MSRCALGLAVAALGLAATAFADTDQAAAPVVVFETSAVGASVTAGGKLLLFSMAREVEQYARRKVRRVELLTDEDGDGVVAWELDQPVPAFSIWAAVDLASGGFALAAPNQVDYPLRRVQFPRGAFAPGQSEDAFSDAREVLDLLLVRPGQGAWVARLGDGAEGDADGARDGQLHLLLAGIEPLGESPERPSPPAFLPDDVVVGIDANRMEVFASTVRAARQGGAK